MTLIAVTGATGYVGRRLVGRAVKKGFRVLALGRRPLGLDGVEDIAYALGDRIALPSDTSVLIHLAATTDDLKPTSLEAEVEAAKSLAASIPPKCRMVFLSTQSAGPTAPTPYSQGKWRIEHIVTEAGGVSIRPGLIYGGVEAGVYGRLMRFLRAFPAYPFFVLPRPIVQPTHIDDIVEALLDARTWPSAVVEVAAPAIPFDAFLRGISPRARFPIPIPLGVAAAVLSLFGRRQLSALASTPVILTSERVRQFSPRRRRVEEGAILIGYFLGQRAPIGAVKRYASASVETPTVIGLGGRLKSTLRDGDNKLRGRYELALRLSEATPLSRDLLLPRAGRLAAVARIVIILFTEVLTFPLRWAWKRFSR